MRPPGGRGVIKSHYVDRNGLWPTPVGDDLDMRRRLPGLLGRFGGNVRGHCQPLRERFIRPHPPRRTPGVNACRVLRARINAEAAERAPARSAAVERDFPDGGAIRPRGSGEPPSEGGDPDRVLPGGDSGAGGGDSGGEGARRALILSGRRSGRGHCGLPAANRPQIPASSSANRRQNVALPAADRMSALRRVHSARRFLRGKGEKGSGKGVRVQILEKGKKGSGANLDKTSLFPSFSPCQGPCVLNFPVPITTKRSGGSKKIASAEAGSGGASLERDDGFAGMDRGQAVNAQPREHGPAAATAGSRKDLAQGAARDAEFF